MEDTSPGLGQLGVHPRADPFGDEFADLVPLLAEEASRDQPVEALGHPFLVHLRDRDEVRERELLAQQRRVCEGSALGLPQLAHVAEKDFVQVDVPPGATGARADPDAGRGAYELLDEERVALGLGVPPEHVRGVGREAPSYPLRELRDLGGGERAQRNRSHGA